MPTARRAGCSASPNAATAITIAFRVPIFANCSGPDGTPIQTAAISSSGASAFRLTPVKKSSIRDQPGAAHRRDLDLGAGREQGRVAVAGR